MSVVLVLAALFRFIWLDRVPGINGDEAWLGCKAYDVAKGAKLDWITYSRNIENPFFMLPLIWLHQHWEPSGWLLRSVAAVSGLLTLPVNWFLCRAVLGRRLAWISTLFLASLPVAIAYSRYGWQPSQVLLFAFPVVYSSIALSDERRNLWLWLGLCAVIALCAALVHPTMAFLFLMPGLGFCARWIRPERRPGRAATLFALGILGAAGLGAAMYLKAPPWVQADISARVRSCVWLFDMGHFAVAWIRNFNGINTFGFFPASWPGSSGIMNTAEAPRLFVLDLLAFVAFAAAGASIMLQVFARGRSGLPHGGSQTVRAGVVVLAGFICASVLFGILSGPQKAAVWFDRYGLWSVAPGIVLLSMGFDSVSRVCGKFSRAFDYGGLLVCAFLLGMFWVKYFSFFFETGGRSGLDARVGHSELKEQAAAEVERWCGSLTAAGVEEKPFLVSSDWFAYWAVVYFLRAGNHNREWETVYIPSTPDPSYTVSEETKQKIKVGHVAIVEYESSDAWKQWEQFFSADLGICPTEQFCDLTGKPVLRVRFVR
ncbi:MAG: glycosyltransferase family 39 protein [Verrucomicrobiota bacterium]